MSLEAEIEAFYGETRVIISRLFEIKNLNNAIKFIKRVINSTKQ